MNPDIVQSVHEFIPVELLHLSEFNPISNVGNNLSTTLVVLEIRGFTRI